MNGNWETMTELIDRGNPDWVKLGAWFLIAILALIVARYAIHWLWLRYKLHELNRRSARAAKAMADREGRRWPL